MIELPKPDEPAWAGPALGGVTQSLINKFLECPYRFYIYAMLGLEDAEPPGTNLIWGSAFHRGVEESLKSPTLISEMDNEQLKHLQDTIKEYISQEYPSAGASFAYSCYRMLLLYNDKYKAENLVQSEVKFSVPYKSFHGHEVTLRGKVDGLADEFLVEHKCVGHYDPHQARLETPFDLQLNLYSMVMGKNQVIYDKIRIPEAQFGLPQKKVNEGIKYWVDRFFDRHAYKIYPITRNRLSWLDQFTVYRTDEEIEQWRRFELDPLIDKLCTYWEKVTDPNFDPNNPEHYNTIFYRKPIRTFDPSKTMKFKCNYHSLLSEETTLEELVPTHFYAELQ